MTLVPYHRLVRDGNTGKFENIFLIRFLGLREGRRQKNTFYRTQVYLGSDLWVQVSQTKSCLVDLIDVTLVDEDTNSILADDTNRAIPGNMEMQVRQSYLVISSKFQNLNQISES